MGGSALRGLGNLFLALVSTLLTLFVFEMGARLFIPEWTPAAGDRRFWRHDESLGWRHRPRQRGIHSHRDFRVEVSINSRGLRDREYPIARDPALRRMLFLGDSFGWGFGVDHEAMLSELLEARRPTWEIINASVSGYGTDQQLLWLQSDGSAYQPDVVLVLFHPNDFLDNHRYSRYGYRKPLFVLEGDVLSLTRVPVPRRSPRARLDRWMYLHVYLYPRFLELPDLVAETLEGWREPADQPLPPEQSTPRAPASPERPRSLRHLTRESEHMRVTHALLRELTAEVESMGARLVVVSVRMVPHLREHLGEMLDELGVDHLPLDRAFATSLRAELHFAHDPHWNPAGHRAAADAVEAFLERIDVLPVTSKESRGERGKRAG